MTLLSTKKDEVLKSYKEYAESVDIVGKEHFSYSQVFSYLKCPFSWYLRKKKGWKEEYSEMSLIGSLVHKAIETHFNNGDVDKAIDNEYNLIIEYNNREHKEFITKEQIIEVVKIIFDTILEKKLLDRYSPILVEKTIDFNISDRYFLRTIPDLITEKGEIVDFKVKRRRPDISFYLNNFQVIYYAIAYEKVFKKLPNKIVIHTFLIGNTKKDGVHIKEEMIKTYSFLGSKEDADFFISQNKITDEEYRLTAVIKAIESGIYPKSTFMSCNMCGFKDICSAHSIKEINSMPDNIKLNELKKFLTSKKKEALTNIKNII